MQNRSNWSLVLIPDHAAVANTGGRLGAASGPDAFLRCFERLNGPDRVHETLTETVSIEASNNIELNHKAAIQLVSDAHRESVRQTSVVVGGGHDHGYTHLEGIKQALERQKSGAKKAAPKLGCINLDAHLDLRDANPKITSGSPFYLALENGTISGPNLIEFGIQRHCNRPDLWDYARSKKVAIVEFDRIKTSSQAVGMFRKSLKKLTQKCSAVAISLDLDVLSAADCPGVSAPQAQGLTATDVIEMIAIAGRERKVVSLGIFELNPEHDRDDQTARFAATAAYHFIAARRGRK